MLEIGILEDPPAGNTTTTNCQCVHGTPVIGPNGECTCTSTATTVPPSTNQALYNANLVCPVGYVKKFTPGGQAYCAPIAVMQCPPGYQLDNGVCRESRIASVASAAVHGTQSETPIVETLIDSLTGDSGNGTIFGFNPLLVIGAAAVGIFMLSSMGDGNKKGAK